MKALLQTADGSPIIMASIPPFLTAPHVLMWGARVFRLHQSPQRDGDPIVYRETFYYAVTINDPTIAMRASRATPEGK